MPICFNGAFSSKGFASKNEIHQAKLTGQAALPCPVRQDRAQDDGKVLSWWQSLVKNVGNDSEWSGSDVYRIRWRKSLDQTHVLRSVLRCCGCYVGWRNWSMIILIIVRRTRHWCTTLFVFMSSSSVPLVECLIGVTSATVYARIFLSSYNDGEQKEAISIDRSHRRIGWQTKIEIDACLSVDAVYQHPRDRTGKDRIILFTRQKKKTSNDYTVEFLMWCCEWRCVHREQRISLGRMGAVNGARWRDFFRRRQQLWSIDLTWFSHTFNVLVTERTNGSLDDRCIDGRDSWW